MTMDRKILFEQVGGPPNIRMVIDGRSPAAVASASPRSIGAARGSIGGNGRPLTVREG
jgi:hypothetical protein